MRPTESDTALDEMHTPTAIKERLAAAKQHNYLGDFVLGSVDGTVTTFAIIAGTAGAGLPSGVAVVLGIANVGADAFSMAASNYLKSRADRHVVERFRRMEEMHIEKIPNAEREEIRQIFARKGFDGQVLEDIVRIITQDRRRWVDTMLTEEWGLQLDSPSPVRAAITTFAAFILAGLVPLLPLFATPSSETSTQTFVASTMLTAITFLSIGVIRGALEGRSRILTGIETLLIGGAAATLAYVVGVLLRGLVVT